MDLFKKLRKSRTKPNFRFSFDFIEHKSLLYQCFQEFHPSYKIGFMMIFRIMRYHPIYYFFELYSVFFTKYERLANRVFKKFIIHTTLILFRFFELYGIALSYDFHPYFPQEQKEEQRSDRCGKEQSVAP